MNENQLTSEKFWRKQEIVPGSTRVPIREIKGWLELYGFKDLQILDLGSGSGRSTEELKGSFSEANIVVFDLSLKALRDEKYKEVSCLQGSALSLPFTEKSFDFIILCGVLTNITDKDKKKALSARQSVAKESARILKNGGLCIVSDFCSKHVLSGYPVNYKRHELITGEWGTIAVFDPEENINFYGKKDEEVKKLAKSPNLLRFAHHYSRQELVDLFQNAGLTPVSYSAEVGTTPSGNKIDSIIYSFCK